MSPEPDINQCTIFHHVLEADLHKCYCTVHTNHNLVLWCLDGVCAILCPQSLIFNAYSLHLNYQIKSFQNTRCAHLVLMNEITLNLISLYG